MKPIPKVGDEIYVGSSMSISNGSSDVVGGMAKVSSVDINERLGKDHVNGVMVSVEEHPGHGYNWHMLSEEQAELKKRFGKKRAYPDPDIDTPWIESGDIVNGKEWTGPPVW